MERQDKAGGETSSRRLQLHGRRLLGLLQMLVRNARLYSPENTIFQRPIQETVACVNEILAAEGRVELTLSENSYYLNGQQLQLEAKALEGLRGLRQEMERCNVGGFFLEQPATSEEIRNFIYIFSAHNTEPAGESGVSAYMLAALKLRRFEKMQEILRSSQEKQTGEPSSIQLDRKRYALVVYARAIFFLQNFARGLRGQGPRLSPLRANPILQDLVDVCREGHSQFLGLISAVRGQDYLVHHSAAVALLSVVFANMLGLSKTQMRQVAYAALFHEVGRLALPEDDQALIEPGTPDQPKENFALAGAKILLSYGGMTAELLSAIQTVRELALPYGRPLADLSGKTIMVEKQVELSPCTRMVAIADAYHNLLSGGLGADAAFELMSGQWRHCFDPLYLKYFGRLLQGLVTRQISEKGEKIEIF
jgi:HD-GYP domain-containing protein (c-di-GMP phosphodiesterase class II)